MNKTISKPLKVRNYSRSLPVPLAVVVLEK
jgi:hypothetical protein